MLRHQNNLNIESDILLFCPVGRLSTRVVLNLTFFYFKRRTWHINTCNFHFRTGSKEIVSFDPCHDRSKKLSERLILHNYSYVYTKNQTEVCVIFFLLIIKMDFRGWYLISKAEKKLGSFHYLICSRFNFSIFVLIIFSSLGWLGDSIVKYTVNKKRQERQKPNNLKSEEEKKLNKLDNIKTEVQVEDTYIQIAKYYMGITCKWMLVVPDT